MKYLFWILVVIAGTSGFAATKLVDIGGWIFFAGYFLGIAVSIAAKYNQEHKQ